MFMEKLFKEIKLHACAELRGCDRMNSYVSGQLSQNLLANCIDSNEAVSRFSQYSQVQMSKL